MNAPLDPANPPPCPLTGQPGAVLVEELSPKLLVDLWRVYFGVTPTPLTKASPRIGLWRSPAGLWFFHPAPEGGAGFYGPFYAKVGVFEAYNFQGMERSDYAAGARWVKPGDKVLDVGCGGANFAALVPQADYLGLDPHAPQRPGGPPVCKDSLAGHAARRPDSYDVVCAFQVIEHVEDPLGMARDMVRCLRPGGLLVLAMPHVGAEMSLLVNNLINLPPHHLSWWTPEAGQALCRELGLEAVEIGLLPAAPQNAALNWMVRLMPRRYRPGRWLRPGYGVHLALGFAYFLGIRLARWRGLPKDAGPNDMILVARKPERPGPGG